MIILTKLTQTLSSIIGWITFLSTFVIVYETILRYFFRTPSEWPHYLSIYGFAYLIMLGGAYVQVSHSHIRTDIIFSKLNLKAKAISEVVFSLCLIIFCAALSWSGWVSFWESLVLKRVQAGVLAWPLWPYLVVIPLGAALTGLWGIVDFFNNLCLLLRGCQSGENVKIRDKQGVR